MAVLNLDRIRPHLGGIGTRPPPKNIRPHLENIKNLLKKENTERIK